MSLDNIIAKIENPSTNRVIRYLLFLTRSTKSRNSILILLISSNRLILDRILFAVLVRSTNCCKYILIILMSVLITKVSNISRDILLSTNYSLSGISSNIIITSSILDSRNSSLDSVVHILLSTRNNGTISI